MRGNSQVWNFNKSDYYSTYNVCDCGRVDVEFSTISTLLQLQPTSFLVV